MAIRYEIRQQVKTVNKRWLEVVFCSDIERVAGTSYDTLKKEHPDEYFELVRVNHIEECLAFTPKFDDED